MISNYQVTASKPFAFLFWLCSTSRSSFFCYGIANPLKSQWFISFLKAKTAKRITKRKRNTQTSRSSSAIPLHSESPSFSPWVLVRRWDHCFTHIFVLFLNPQEIHKLKQTNKEKNTLPQKSNPQLCLKKTFSFEIKFTFLSNDFPHFKLASALSYRSKNSFKALQTKRATFL